MNAWLTRFLYLIAICGAGASPPLLHAHVIVLANRSPEEVSFTLTPAGATAHDHKLPPRDLMAVPAPSDMSITFHRMGRPSTVRLEADRAYVFRISEDSLTLTGIGPPPRRESPGMEEGSSPPGKARAASAGASGLLTLPVMILADHAEPMTREAWERRLRERLAAASAICERQCRVKLDVVAVDSWESDGRLAELGELLRDFERKVKPQKARLAIGFTSQRFPHVAGQHLGAIRQPLARHILVREYFPRTEPERLEVLVHELGHFLGATHSPESDSAMRPILGDGRARKTDFPIGFDPLGALVINLVVEEMRGHELKSLGELSRPTRMRLAPLYEEIASGLPKDPTPAKYLALLGFKPPAPEGNKP
jgi:hypothetical protein